MKKETISLISTEDAKNSAEKLSTYYENDLIPAEKKSYLTNLEASSGPFMGIEGKSNKASYLMDAASQIATLGLGFNSSSFFGVAHHQETWTNNFKSENFKKIRESFKNFLIRKTGIPELSFRYCHSGAEANETALGFCYRRRQNLNANKILAFEGSFHGRMMMSLASTWNKTKREPFEWPGFQTSYVSYPKQKHDHLQAEFPPCWRKIWDQSSGKKFQTPEVWEKDEQLKEELISLLQVRDNLKTGEIFAVMIEPMQCEGGDNYSTDRFHTALLIMARSFGVPVIYDEVQTGFHLGREFFWHSQFNLRNIDGTRLNPDYIVCAKKAQTGLVISTTGENLNYFTEEFSVASAIRGYNHAIMLDQYQEKIINLEEYTRLKLQALVQKYSTHLSSPRLCGMSFAFDLSDPELITKFVAHRFEHGLLYYPAGSHTLRFRLNTSFFNEDIDFLFDRLNELCARLLNNEDSSAQSPKEHQISARGVESLYEWHRLLLKEKLSALDGGFKNEAEVLQNIRNIYKDKLNLEFNIINDSNLTSYQEKILDLQKKVYEPARQTGIETFEKVIKSSYGFGLTLERDGRLLGMTFASPLEDHPLERGVRRDPYYCDNKSLYMVDLTVDPALKGQGIGKTLKYSLSLLALSRGIKRIQGRNRDRLAKEMLNINLSLGAFEQSYIEEDYPDFESHRDVYYYTLPLKWHHPELDLSHGLTSHLETRDLDYNHLSPLLPYAINKICLSNFVSESFLYNLKNIIEPLPSELQHAYTTSGQSECVDKIAKSLWFNRHKGNQACHQLTFKGHYFGGGSLLSQSLSIQDKEQSYFPVTELPCPTELERDKFLEALENELKKGSYMAIWLEPLKQKNLQKIPIEIIKDIKVMANKYQVSLVFNETASQMYRFHEDYFFASSIEDIRPTAGMSYLGGQAGVVFLEEDFFVSKPLMMISTWDGDELSLSLYIRAANALKDDSKAIKKLRKEFSQSLKKLLSQYSVNELILENGFGSFKGSLPHSLARYFSRSDDRFIICPTASHMHSFLKEYPL